MKGKLVVAGIDGGATATTCVIADGSGRILGTGRGGPIDHLFLPAGRSKTQESIRQAISRAIRAARVRAPARAVVAGLTGLEPGSTESRVAVGMIRKLIRANIIRATWDAEIALAGAAGNGPGIVVIAGTGSVALGRDGVGRTARAGGYGFLVDDAGGGVSIGQAALRAALRSLEGEAAATRLSQMMKAELGDWPQIRRRVYGAGGGRPLLASLVPIVAKAARQGDAVAVQILEDAGRSLARLAIAVASHLGLINKPFDVFPLGGVFEIGKPVIDPMRTAIHSRAPHCRIRQPKYPAVMGAVFMALEAAKA